MTLIIAAHGSDSGRNNFVILGADCRGVVESSGSRAELNIMNKLAKLADHVGILIAGDGHIGNYLVERFTEENADNNIDGISNVAEQFSEFCRQQFRSINDVPTIELPAVVFIIAGLDEINGQYQHPKIFISSSNNGFLLGRSPTPYEIQGKPFIALYKFAKRFEENKNSINKLSKFIAQSIFDTHEIDGDVGLPSWIARITLDGYEKLTERDARELYATWEEQRLDLIASE